MTLVIRVNEECEHYDEGERLRFEDDGFDRFANLCKTFNTRKTHYSTQVPTEIRDTREVPDNWGVQA